MNAQIQQARRELHSNFAEKHFLGCSTYTQVARLINLGPEGNPSSHFSNHDQTAPPSHHPGGDRLLSYDDKFPKDHGMFTKDKMKVMLLGQCR